MKRGIIILGLGRSGTSLVAQLVHRWGAYLGPDQQLQFADSWNPQGHWEYLPLSTFNYNLLAHLDSNMVVPPADDQQVRACVDRDDYRQNALKLVNTMAEGGDVWAWKHPALSLLLPFWQEIWSDVAYIIPTRNPYDQALSMRNMYFEPNLPLDHFPFSTAFLVWQCYMHSILRNTEHAPQKLFLAYELLLRDPQRECRRLADFLDRSSGRAPSSDSTVEQMAATIKQSFWRNQGGKPFQDLAQATPAQKALYTFLHAKIDDPHLPFEPEQFPLFPAWRRLLQEMTALNPLDTYMW